MKLPNLQSPGISSKSWTFSAPGSASCKGFYDKKAATNIELTFTENI